MQVCVNTMPRRKDISIDLRETIVAAHQSEKGYEAISKLFGVPHSTAREIIHKRKTFQTLNFSFRLNAQKKMLNIPRATSPTLKLKFMTVRLEKD